MSYMTVMIFVFFFFVKWFYKNSKFYSIYRYKFLINKHNFFKNLKFIKKQFKKLISVISVNQIDTTGKKTGLSDW